MKGRPGIVRSAVAAILASATSPASSVMVRGWSWLRRKGAQRWSGRRAAMLATTSGSGPPAPPRGGPRRPRAAAALGGGAAGEPGRDERRRAAGAAVGGTDDPIADLELEVGVEWVRVVGGEGG